MFKKILLWLLFISIAIATLIFTFVIYVNFSEGKRAGELIKMSRKGVIFKTYEGQLNTGGFSEGDGDIPVYGILVLKLRMTTFYKISIMLLMADFE